MIRRQCIDCDGDGELVVGVRNIEVTGGVIDFVTIPCSSCQGEGWLPPFTWRTLAMAVGIYVVVQVLVTIAVLMAIQVAAPRPAANVIPAEDLAGRASASASSRNLSLQTGAPRDAVRGPWPGMTAAERLGAPAGQVGTAIVAGDAGWAEESFGPRYLATQFPRGTRVRICGAICRVMTTTDYGPDPRIDPPRVADIAVARWEVICGLPRTAGLCDVTIETFGRIRLPATDTAP